MNTKQCTKCKETKDLEDFPKCKGAKGGRSSWCKKCHSDYCAEPIHLQQNRDRRREKRKDPEYRKQEQAREKIRRESKYKESWLSSLRKNAKDRNIPFNLTVEDIPNMPKLCPILKVLLVKNTWYAPSVDRIDNTKGYVKGNIQIISRLANTMKAHATPEEILNFSKFWIKFYKTQ